MFLDVTDIVDFNITLLGHANLHQSFFCLRRHDPTDGFAFDASSLAGHAYTPNQHGPRSTAPHNADDALLIRLIVGSHLANHIRMQMEQQMGYTATVGISTSKLLSKLVGNVNKPRNQTTLLPPYEVDGPESGTSNVTSFMDAHDIGKVPDIGFKMSHKLRDYVLDRLGNENPDAMHTSGKARVTVADLRTLPGIDARMLEDVLAGPGMQRGIGYKTWCLIHGVDDSEVALAKETPKQISIEDSYLRMDTFEGVCNELLSLAKSLIRRMRTDLTEQISIDDEDGDQSGWTRWLAHPKTLRLSTRPRPPPGADGRRGRASNRISRSSNLPSFVFSFSETVDTLAQRLVQECLIPLFRQLHPEKLGWDLSLINIAVVNMAETAGTSKAAIGRDIGNMFRTQEKNLQPWKVEEEMEIEMDEAADRIEDSDYTAEAVAVDDGPTNWQAPITGSEDALPSSQATQPWYDSDDNDDDQSSSAISCPLCGAAMPEFAIAAHLRYHETND